MIAVGVILAAVTALEPVKLGDVKLTGWIGAKAENLFRERVTSDWARNVMMKECEDVFLARKDDAVRPDEPLHLGLWQGEYWGKTMIGFAQVAVYKRDPGMIGFIRESAYRIMALQDPDGYIGTYTNKLFLKVHVDPERLRRERHVTDHNWNVWCRSFTAWGLYEAARATGDPKILEAGARSLLQLIDMLHANGISITDTGTNAGMPSCTIINPVLLFYEATGNAKFLDFAREIVGKWDRNEDIPPNFFRHVDSGLSPYHWYEGAPFQFDWPKANETLICLQGLVDYARITGDRRSFEVVEKMFDIIRTHERNAIFSVSYNDRFHEAVTIPTAVTETCDTVMWLQLLKKLYLTTGKAKYADELELVYLNPFLAGMTRDGKWGNRGVRSHSRHGAGPAQAGMKHSHCCVNNLPRGFMEFAEAELAKDADGVYRVAFYTDAEAAMGDVKVSIDGNWPVADIAKVRVTAPAGTRFRFRKPAWSKTMKVNGRDVSAVDGWWETSVAAGGGELAFAFDLRPQVVPLDAKPDPDNALRPYEVMSRWMICDKWDIMPYFHCRDLPRVMRGPLLLAKSTRVGATEDEVFGWGGFPAVDQIDVRAEPLERQNVWGAWRLFFHHRDDSNPNRNFCEVNACDFQSAGDSHDACPTKTFCIFY